MENKNTIRRKIIYVDDVSFSLASVKARLKQYYEVYAAESTEKMFELLAKVTPEMIILDVNMPEVDGFEAGKRLKEDPIFSLIPFMFLSGQKNRDNIIKGFQCGAVDFMFKPFTDSDLVENIEFHLTPEKQRKNKPIILAVDDEPSMLRSIDALLKTNYTVYTLSKPEKINDLLNIVVPDLLLLDCNMPVMTGFDLVPLIRKHRHHQETPIMFLTTEGNVDAISVAIGLGACDYIVKPIDDNILREKVGKNLKDYLMYRRLRSIL